MYKFNNERKIKNEKDYIIDFMFCYDVYFCRRSFCC